MEFKIENLEKKLYVSVDNYYCIKLKAVIYFDLTCDGWVITRFEKTFEPDYIDTVKDIVNEVLDKRLEEIENWVKDKLGKAERTVETLKLLEQKFKEKGWEIKAR